MSYGNETRYIGTFASEPLANAALDAAVAVFAAEPSQGRSAKDMEATAKRAKEAAMNVAMQMSGKQKENKTMIHCKRCCDHTHPKPFAYSRLRHVRGRTNGGAWAWRTDYAQMCDNCGRHSEWAPTVNEHTQRLENEAIAKAQSRVTVDVDKPLKDSKLGIDLKHEHKSGVVTVGKISRDGLFADTELKEGMKIETINGRHFESFQQLVNFLKATTGHITIYASAQ